MVIQLCVDRRQSGFDLLAALARQEARELCQFSLQLCLFGGQFGAPPGHAGAALFLGTARRQCRPLLKEAALRGLPTLRDRFRPFRCRWDPARFHRGFHIFYPLSDLRFCLSADLDDHHAVGQPLISFIDFVFSAVILRRCHFIQELFQAPGKVRLALLRDDDRPIL